MVVTRARTEAAAEKPEPTAATQNGWVEEATVKVHQKDPSRFLCSREGALYEGACYCPALEVWRKADSSVESPGGEVRVRCRGEARAISPRLNPAMLAKS